MSEENVEIVRRFIDAWQRDRDAMINSSILTSSGLQLRRACRLLMATRGQGSAQGRLVWTTGRSTNSMSKRCSAREIRSSLPCVFAGAGSSAELMSSSSISPVHGAQRKDHPHLSRSQAEALEAAGLQGRRCRRRTWRSQNKVWRSSTRPTRRHLPVAATRREVVDPQVFYSRPAPMPSRRDSGAARRGLLISSPIRWRRSRRCGFALTTSSVSIKTVSLSGSPWGAGTTYRHPGRARSHVFKLRAGKILHWQVFLTRRSPRSRWAVRSRRCRRRT